MCSKWEWEPCLCSRTSAAISELTSVSSVSVKCYTALLEARKSIKARLEITSPAPLIYKELKDTEVRWRETTKTKQETEKRCREIENEGKSWGILPSAFFQACLRFRCGYHDFLSLQIWIFPLGPCVSSFSLVMRWIIVGLQCRILEIRSVQMSYNGLCYNPRSSLLIFQSSD